MGATFLTIFLTVISGVLVFVIGQIIIKFFVEPIHEQWKVIGLVCDTLIYYAGFYAVPNHGRDDKDREEANRKTREMSTLLISRTHLVPWYNLFETLRIVKKKSKIISAARNMFGLLSDMYDENNGLLFSRNRIKEIEDNLGVIISDERLLDAANKK